MVRETDISVGLLIGNNCPVAFKPREVRVGGDHDDEPFGLRSDLGWAIMGSLESNPDTQPSANIVNKIIAHPAHNKSQVAFKCQPETNKQINKIIDILSQDFTDFASNTDSMSIEDKMFLKLMHKETRMENDHVTMPLPLKQKPPINNSFKTAQSRFRTLQSKLTKDKVLSKQYHTFMNELISNNEAELVPQDELTNQSWYIPHFEVWHPKKPNKIRVVFDGSAKTDGKSINDYLMQGPDFMNSLIGILLRFRQERIGVTCDIERMFHQFRVAKKDRDYLRFLWFDSRGEVATYRMNVHIFGAKSSPACASYGLRFIAQQLTDPSQVQLEARNFIEHNFYVDDGLLSAKDTNSAIQVLKEAVELCQQGSVHLHKILSNAKEVVAAFPKSEHANSLQELNLSSDVLPTDNVGC